MLRVFPTVLVFGLSVFSVNVPTDAQAKQPKKVHVDADQHYQIDIPQGWVAQPVTSLLLHLQNKHSHMTVSRIDAPNLLAWRRKSSKSFISEILSGLAPGTTLLSHHVSRQARVPTLDLHFSRKQNAEVHFVWMRFLLYRRYTLVATSSISRKSSKHTRRIAQQFCHSLRPIPAIK